MLFNFSNFLETERSITASRSYINFNLVLIFYFFLFPTLFPPTLSPETFFQDLFGLCCRIHLDGPDFHVRQRNFRLRKSPIIRSIGLSALWKDLVFFFFFCLYSLFLSIYPYFCSCVDCNLQLWLYSPKSPNYAFQ